jgi:hypothetical protein
VLALFEALAVGIEPLPASAKNQLGRVGDAIGGV